MAVDEHKLADARMPATELTVPRSDQVVRPLTEVPFRLAGDPREVPREVAVPNRPFTPARAALPPLRADRVFFADQERLARSISNIGKHGASFRRCDVAGAVELAHRLAHHPVAIWLV